MNMPRPDNEGHGIKLEELAQQLRTIHRQRADESGLHFRRFVTGVNVGGIVVTLYICKTLIELDPPINPFNYSLQWPFFLYFIGIIITGASNAIAKYKRVKDADNTRKNLAQTEWNEKSLYVNSYYEYFSSGLFVLAVILEVCILRDILNYIIP